jgi:Response regulator containing CheY-like receiver, AAA-type ATPase, and DNA-binding domains
MRHQSKRKDIFMAHPAILVVDDDQVILQSFARILERHGYDVETAATGHEAIERCKNGSYNVALLDIKLPDMDGTQLLKELHAVSDTMVKIMVTGYASLDSALQSLLLEADAYVLKPVEPDELLKVVTEALSERQTK